MEQATDIAVVGAGPAGLSVGIAARREGLDCLILERGCITQCIYDYPTYATFFSTADELELGCVPFTVAGDKATRREALKYYRRVVDHFELDVCQYRDVVQVRGARGDFRLLARDRFGGETLHHARAVAVATGYARSPNRLDVPGEELPKVTHYYTDPHPYFRQDCVVVGGGNSAVEAALELYRGGARVTLVHFEGRLDPGVKPWILPDITNRLAAGEIAVHWHSRIAEIGARHVLLRSEEDGSIREIANDWVLAMTGYLPDPRLVRELGVGIDPVTGIPIHDPITMETNVSGVFIAGVVAGGNQPNKIFIKHGREHGPRIAGAVAAADPA